MSTVQSDPPSRAIRDGYRAPGFTDTYNQLGDDIVARLERHWSLGRGERRASMLPDIGELQFGLESGADLDRTRRRRLRALVPRAWQVVGVELESRLTAVEDVLNASDPETNEHGFYWIGVEGRRLTGEWGEVAAERAHDERQAVLSRMLEASGSLDQMVQNLDMVKWLALQARGRLTGRWVLRGILGRIRRLHDRAAELIELHQRHTL